MVIIVLLDLTGAGYYISDFLRSSLNLGVYLQKTFQKLLNIFKIPGK